ncbi:hypothetical protein PTE30175_05387 [Pandoraea terrae]|uniref:Uncharacterized protein n=1 Tax=Pandoraea terrae TaxID=1537710 RepID=A0A5E4ZG47_9BURK|nr:hypothetical protein [Pandoraea terrae]VVE59153.1 hypothetical protein PTE30175_05387 [Pandoraea terrae]
MALGDRELAALRQLHALARRRERRLAAALSAMQAEAAALDDAVRACRERSAQLYASWETALARCGMHDRQDFEALRGEADGLRAQVAQTQQTCADLLRQREALAQRIAAQREAIRANAMKQEKLTALLPV